MQFARLRSPRIVGVTQELRARNQTISNGSPPISLPLPRFLKAFVGADLAKGTTFMLRSTVQFDQAANEQTLAMVLSIRSTVRVRSNHEGETDFAGQRRFDNHSSFGIIYVPQKNLGAISETVEANN